jgi:hypothetical protein
MTIRSVSIIARLLLVALVSVLVMCADSGVAQTTKKKTTTQPAAKPAPTPEQKVTTAPAPTSVVPGLKEFLEKYVGTRTSLGKLTKVEADYIVVDDDGTSVIYPMGKIESIRIHKAEEEEEDPISIEIKIG